jgi:hypothetical protein
MSITKDYPSSKIINTLVRKIDEDCINIDFNFISHLDNLKELVSQEISYINNLFPEYTPHNEKYHIKNLFTIADQILGDSVISNMNSVELFLLVASLYAHDWGMAVSENEKRIILDLATKKNVLTNDFSLIDHEKEKIYAYLKDHCDIDSLNCTNPSISIDLWRNYIRNTHSERSGERIYNFLKNFNLGIAEATKRICNGHGLNFEDLRNKKHYTTNLSVLNHSVNIRAITIYVRLIDLLDLTEDRTPYVIWKYVSPQNQYSKMEWNKHRALYSIACSPYQEGRTIKIDGSTDDHEVYAALNDLMDWCNSQFKSCNDLLAEMNSPNHKLNIYHIDWNISAKGFNPINIRFEFDRSRMFQILGEEIYNDDPYVFLRELLQNSIDAIMTRAEWLKQKHIPVDISSFGSIKVEVVSDETQIIITWQDNGIGMNEYIIRNYLSVAGKSYYSSNDFKLTGIKIDPISKFGIGLLSCSTVSNYIEILTFRDPYLEPSSTALLVKIPSFDKYFRVEDLAGQDYEVGTTVKIYIDKTSDKAKKFDLSCYDVTKYISHIAGFIKIPIFINDNGKVTNIIHPYINQETAITKSEEDICVSQIDLSFQLDSIIVSKSADNLSDIIEEKICFIDKDLCLTGFEGVISYPCLIDKNYDISLIDNSLIISDINSNTRHEILVSNNKYSAYPDNDYVVNMCPSCKIKRDIVLYMDGILVSDVNLYNYFDSYENPYFSPRVLINICNNNSANINLSRNNLLNNNNIIYDVYEAFMDFIIKGNCEYLRTLDTYNRFKDIERLIMYSYVKLQFIPHDLVVIPILKNNGEIDIVDWNDIKNDIIYTIPSNIEAYCNYALNAKVHDEKSFDFYLETYWKCDVNSIITTGSHYGNSYSKISKSMDKLLNDSHYQSGVRFLSPPLINKLPMIQYKLEPIGDIISLIGDNTAFIKRMLDKDYCITSKDFLCIKYIMNMFHNKTPIDTWALPEITEFLYPYDKCFGYGTKILNLKHCLTQVLTKSLFKIAYDLSTNVKFSHSNHMNVANINTIIHKISHLSKQNCSYKDFTKYWNELWTNLPIDYLAHIGYHNVTCPPYEDFFENTIFKDAVNTETSNDNDYYNLFEYEVFYIRKEKQTIIEFGKPYELI